MKILLVGVDWIQLVPFAELGRVARLDVAGSPEGVGIQ